MSLGRVTRGEARRLGAALASGLMLTLESGLCSESGLASGPGLRLRLKKGKGPGPAPGPGPEPAPRPGPGPAAEPELGMEELGDQKETTLARSLLFCPSLDPLFCPEELPLPVFCPGGEEVEALGLLAVCVIKSKSK